MGAHLLVIVKHRNNGPVLGVPADHYLEEIGYGPVIHGVEGLIEEDDGCVLEQQAGEKNPLELALREIADGPALKTLQSHRGQGFPGLPPQFVPHAGEHADALPEPQGHEVQNRYGETPVDLRLLRQVGDPGDLQATQVDPTGKGPQDADNSLQQGAFPRAVGTHHRGHRPRLEASGKMMDRGMPVISQGEIVDHNGSHQKSL